MKISQTILRYRADTSVWAIINKVCRLELWFLCSAHPSIMFYICSLYEVSRKYLKRSLRYRADTSVWWKWSFSILKGQKVGKQELRFMFSARRLMVFNVCVNFHENM